MPDRADILRLIPHQGSMCLLDGAIAWTETDILCHARSHLDPANPLRRHGRLSTVCGLEYALQAAALHGALRGGAPQPAGWLAALRNVIIRVPRLDDPALGRLEVEARMEHGEASGLVYGFCLRAGNGSPLAEGRATIALPHPTLPHPTLPHPTGPHPTGPHPTGPHPTLPHPAGPA